jgi:hypothetical protein
VPWDGGGGAGVAAHKQGAHGGEVVCPVVARGCCRRGCCRRAHMVAAHHKEAACSEA